MYNSPHFEETRPEVLHGLMASRPFATLIVSGSADIEVNHIPLLLDAADGPLGTLRGHVARANPVWRELPGTRDAVAVFQGPQAYITPSWYPSKQADGKTVPTWNYAVVHARGSARAIEDAGWLLRHVTALTTVHESGQTRPWNVSDAPANFIERMLGAIVGIEIPIARIEGKWKLNQNRTQADKLGVVAGLESRASDEARELAGLMLRYAVSLPND